MRFVASRTTQIHACIANGENAAGGFGLTAQTAEEMFASGVDFITGGNHIFDKRDFGEYLESSNRVIRPANYPPAAARAGRCHVCSRRRTRRRAQSHGPDVHAAGRRPVSLRRRYASADLRRPDAGNRVSTFTPRRPRRRSRMARYLDGRVSCVFGTHTHVQTADEQILPGRHRLHQRPWNDRPDGGQYRHGERSRARPVSYRPFGAVQRAKTRDETVLARAVVSIDPGSGKAMRSSASFCEGIA